jgi:hypothetical protein
MRRVLLILTRPQDDLGDALAKLEQGQPETEIITMDLTVESPDYAGLVEAIFAADSVQVW